MELVRSVLTRIESVIGAAERPVPLHEPLFRGNEWLYVKDCLDRRWVSSAGQYVDRLERAMESVTGAAHAVAVVNGTAALHLCLRLVGVTAGDEVLLPALSFVATANAVSYLGAIPHFVDVEEQTLGIDAAKLRNWLSRNTQARHDSTYNRQSGRRLAAIIPMHTFGHPVDMQSLLAVTQELSLPVVEDAAESLGSLYQGRHTGRFGQCAALSFNGNKIATTGGGGALLTEDHELAGRAKHLSTTAKLAHPWQYEHDLVGYNYRMPNINAALGCAQLEQLDDVLSCKRALARRYQKAFAGLTDARIFCESADARSNYWLNLLLLGGKHGDLLQPLLDAAHAAGILVRPAWRPLHTLPMYRDCPRMELTNTESLAQRIVCLPSSPSLAMANYEG